MDSTREGQYASALGMLRGLIANETPSEEELRAKITALRSTAFFPLLKLEDESLLFDEIAASLRVRMDVGIVVEARDHEPWLEGAEVEWRHWKAYHQALINTGRGPAVIDSLGKALDIIVDHSGNPAVHAPWSRRCLVVGDVQSGKTSAYIGLMNKAIDVGYKIVILLTGNAESLRQQTQSRIDEGVIGRDTLASVRRAAELPVAPARVGIGMLIDTSSVLAMTTMTSDFRHGGAEAVDIVAGDERVLVFVVKKNVTVLRRIIKWLSLQESASGKLRFPALVIDDESDYASVNTKDPENDPTAINKAIRDILRQFSRSSYVAFTATPFANVFIDDEVEDDLFPSDLILGLDSPSNYVGPQRMFGRSDSDEDDTIRHIDDAEDCIPLNHRRSFLLSRLPESLHEAIRTFLLINAIRDLRGHTSSPRSMLVNVSRFNDVQEQVFEAVQAEVIRYRNAIEWHSEAFANGAHNPLLEAMKEAFEREFSALEFGWKAVLEMLPKSTRSIVTLLMNSKSDEKLEQDQLSKEEPQRYVAVGGNLLSRGLTLGGLCVSYFYRRTEADDTLMQMGRWFGYREGYADVCRVWMSEETAAHFAHATDSLEELRLELIRMRNQRLTPRQYGIAVKNHPGAHRLTARGKMRATATGPRSISLRGRTVESYCIPGDRTVRANNLDAAYSLLRQLELAMGEATLTAGERPIWRGVPKKLVADFLIRFADDASSPSPIFHEGALGEFAKRAISPDLQEWDVAVVPGESSQDRKLPGVRKAVHLARRSVTRSASGALMISGSSRRVAGRGDVSTPLEPEVRRRVREDYRAEEGGKGNVPDPRYTAKLERPLLLLYFTEATESAGGEPLLVEPSPTVAVVVAIPGQSEDVIASEQVTYTMNTVAQRLTVVQLELGSDEDD